jgi:DNA/RNA endonuclease G (NUC1)
METYTLQNTKDDDAFYEYEITVNKLLKKTDCLLLSCVTPVKYKRLNEKVANTDGAIQHGKSRETGHIDEEKQSKNTTQYVFDTTIRKQTQITNDISQNTKDFKHDYAQRACNDHYPKKGEGRYLPCCS